MTKPKFTKGLGFLSTESAIVWMMNGGGVYFNHKYMSSKFVMNWSVIQIKIAVESGRMVRSIPLAVQTERQKNDQKTA